MATSCGGDEGSVFGGTYSTSWLLEDGVTYSQGAQGLLGMPRDSEEANPETAKRPDSEKAEIYSEKANI